LVQVPNPQLPGYGGQAAKPIGWQDSPYQDYPGLPGTPTPPIVDPIVDPGPFDPRGAFQIPNNFWGFVILMLGLR